MSDDPSFWTIFLFLLIYAAAAFILTFTAMFLVHRWTANKIIKKAAEKSKASEPVNCTAIDFTYSQEVLANRIKKQAEELRRITEGRGK